MSSPSNLYAEKVFSEHPLVLWALDDQLDYLSLISENQRKVFNWDISNGTGEEYTDISDEPFISSNVSKVTGDLTQESFGQVVLVSEDINNFSIFNSELGTFSIGAYFYSLGAYLAGVEVGYEYYDTSSGEKIQHTKLYSTSMQEKWFFASETFDIPKQNTTFRIVLKINYIGGAQSQNDYEFLINGVSLGQWSEEFNAESLGINKVSIPEGIPVSQQYGVEASAYGLQDNHGYYLIEDNSLAAKNSGIPMVYGASNITQLRPIDGPSLIIPGQGFLHNNGKFNDYSLEFWTRVSTSSHDYKRIVGPVASTDGIYVNGPFITLKIDGYSSSYYVGEWNRPMLVHFLVNKNGAFLFINGEQVISLDYDVSNIIFPSSDSDDWIGFYAHTETEPFEVDCVAIYPYAVPLLVAKRRFVYGQGVEFPEGINKAYSGSSVYIDYPFANYSNNYMYPDIGKWNEGLIDNLVVRNNILSTPTYSLPDLVVSGYTDDEIYSFNSVAQNESDLFFTFNPLSQGNQIIENPRGYMLFNNLNFINSQIKSFFGVFKVKSLNTEVGNKQVLFYIDSESNTNSFSIVLENDTINYKIKYNGVEETVYSSYGIVPGEMFSVALDIDKFSNYYGGIVSSFLGNFNNLRVSIGGRAGASETFKGNIYKIGFANSRNNSKLSAMFNEKGTAADYENLFDTYSSTVDHDAGDQYFGSAGGYYNNSGVFIPMDADFWIYYLDGGTPSGFSAYKFINHTASYTLVPTTYFGEYSLDIDISAYWEDYIPLSYFSKNIIDAKGNSLYDLDFIQFNVNYPAPSMYIEEENIGSWTYDELKAEYANPVRRTYDSLDNQLFTGYLDYTDLQNKSLKNYKYLTSNELLRSYVTFQYVETGANAPIEYFSNTELAPKEGIVNPGKNWMTTKYEVVDNMIIYPPSSADHTTLALVTHLDFNITGILKRSINIKSLEYSSQSFNEVQPNEIGTRFGTKIYPYRKSGIYYDYKRQNPFAIYKKSSPYLYLTRYSGIELKGTYDPLINRGLSIPINEEKSENYKVLALQAAVKFDQDFFPYSPTQIFEIEAKNTHLKFYMVANHPSGKRAKIYAINAKTGRLENGIGFYWNGKIVKEPVLTIKEWGFLGISFPVLLDFKNYLGSFNINGPLMFNTISHYQSTNLQEVKKTSTRPWFSVKTVPPIELEWYDWTSFIWDGVLVRSSTSFYGVDPSTIYKSYTGTNKIIVDSGKELVVNGCEYSIYSGLTWNQTVLDAL